MRTFTAVIERDSTTGLYFGWVPGVAGARSQGAALEELDSNHQEVLAMLAKDGMIEPQTEFVGTHSVRVG